MEANFAHPVTWKPYIFSQYVSSKFVGNGMMCNFVYYNIVAEAHGFRVTSKNSKKVTFETLPPSTAQLEIEGTLIYHV